MLICNTMVLIKIPFTIQFTIVLKKFNVQHDGVD
jgi:hypothetical protein